MSSFAIFGGGDCSEWNQELTRTVWCIRYTKDQLIQLRETAFDSPLKPLTFVPITPNWPHHSNHQPLPSLLTPSTSSTTSIYDHERDNEYLTTPSKPDLRTSDYPDMLYATRSIEERYSQQGKDVMPTPVFNTYGHGMNTMPYIEDDEGPWYPIGPPITQ